MTVFLHIGSHKTGTTVIQRYASVHRKELRQKGLWYPSYEEAGLSASHYAHHDLAHAIAGEPGRVTQDEAARFFRHIRKNHKQGENILISAEPIFRHVIAQENIVRTRLKGEEFWSAHRNYLEKLRDVLACDNLKIVVFLRRQDQFAPSLYQEQVKATKYDGKFERFIRQKRHLFDYLRHLQELQAVFGNVMARPFDDLLANGDLIGNFFSALGVADLGAVPRERSNKSLPFQLVELKRLLNKHSASSEESSAFQAPLIELAQSGKFVDEQKYSWLPPEEMAKFQADFDADNKKLHLYSDFDRDENFFPARDRTEYVPFPGLSTEGAVEICARLMLSERLQRNAVPPRRFSALRRHWHRQDRMLATSHNPKE